MTTKVLAFLETGKFAVFHLHVFTRIWNIGQYYDDFNDVEYVYTNSLVHCMLYVTIYFYFYLFYLLYLNSGPHGAGEFFVFV